MKIISYDDSRVRIQLTPEDVDQLENLDVGGDINGYLSELYYEEILDTTGIEIVDLLPENIVRKLNDAIQDSIEAVLDNLDITLETYR